MQRNRKGVEAMSKGRITKTVFTAMLILLVLGVSPAETLSSSKKLNLTVLGGTVGGMWYVVAGGLSEIFKEVLPDSTISVEPGGGASNVSLISSGEAHLGLANACSLYDGWHGAEPFGTPPAYLLRRTRQFHLDVRSAGRKQALLQSST
jgi:TRAP-type uncharacterized transport system substrate-binding protein